MSKGTYNPSTLNDPETIFTNTSTNKAMYSLMVDCSELTSGDILKVTITTDTTGTTGSTAVDYITIDTIGESAIAMSYPIIQDEDDTYTVILEQTDGSVRDFDWSVIMVEY